MGLQTLVANDSLTYPIEKTKRRSGFSQQLSMEAVVMEKSCFERVPSAREQHHVSITTVKIHGLL